MCSDKAKLLHNCLYFTANALARQVTKLAEEAFRPTGLAPSQAFLLMLVNEQPGITQKELGEALHLAPSTITRMVDHLSSRKGLVKRQSQGRTAPILPTEQGGAMMEQIARCWHDLHERYSKVLGEETGRRLNRDIDQASGILSRGSENNF
jgi:DNA-binding MarR family transcriptional regulator